MVVVYNPWLQFWNNAVYTLGVYNGVTTFAIGIVTLLTFFISCATCCMVCRQNKNKSQRVHPAQFAEPQCNHGYMPNPNPPAAYFIVPNGARQISPEGGDGPAVAVPNPPLYAPHQQQQQQQPKGIYPNIQ